MKHKNEPVFTWNEQLGEATCLLTDGEHEFWGMALCHNADADMKSEKTGYEIAYKRAMIKALVYNRECIIKPALAAYKQLYYSMNQSKNFNPKSYENKMLQRKIREKQSDLDVINEMIVTAKEDLTIYLQEKNNFYKKIRSNRNKAKTN